MTDLLLWVAGATGVASLLGQGSVYECHGWVDLESTSGISAVLEPGARGELAVEDVLSEQLWSFQQLHSERQEGTRDWAMRGMKPLSRWGFELAYSGVATPRAHATAQARDLVRLHMVLVPGAMRALVACSQSGSKDCDPGSPAVVAAVQNLAAAYPEVSIAQLEDLVLELWSTSR